MAVHLNCKCGYKKDLPNFYAGKHVRCPSCSTVNVIPSAEIFDIEVDVVTPPLANADLPQIVKESAALIEIRPDRANNLDAVRAQPVSMPEVPANNSKVHPGAASSQSLPAVSPPALPSALAANAPLAPNGQPRQLATASVFKVGAAPAQNKPSTTLGNINLAIGVIVASLATSPYVSLALIGIYGSLTIMTIVCRAKSKTLGVFPFVILIAAVLVGFHSVDEYKDQKRNRTRFAQTEFFEHGSEGSQLRARTERARRIVSAVNEALTYADQEKIVRDPKSVLNYAAGYEMISFQDSISRNALGSAFTINTKVGDEAVAYTCRFVDNRLILVDTKWSSNGSGGTKTLKKESGLTAEDIR
ncbi:MAG: hypothetical protein KDB07_05955 [Planctomycetes bacterium]|nr:hypothetical protein [Planctomycetota bacterium]